jgi:hypothetical protein
MELQPTSPHLSRQSAQRTVDRLPIRQALPAEDTTIQSADPQTDSFDFLSCLTGCFFWISQAFSCVWNFLFPSRETRERALVSEFLAWLQVSARENPQEGFTRFQRLPARVRLAAQQSIQRGHEREIGHLYQTQRRAERKGSLPSENLLRAAAFREFLENNPRNRILFITLQAFIEGREFRNLS